MRLPVGGVLIIPQSDEMEFDGYRFDTRWSGSGKPVKLDVD